MLAVAPLLVATLVVVVAVIRQLPGAPPVYTDVRGLLSNNPATARSRAVAVVGTVQPSSRHYKGYSEWAFVLERDGLVVPVRYTGPVPSTFRDGARVMVVGKMRDGTFSATSLLVSM